MVESPAAASPQWILAVLRRVVDIEVAPDDGRDVGLAAWQVARRIAQNANDAIDVVLAMQAPKPIPFAVPADLREVEVH